MNVDPALEEVLTSASFGIRTLEATPDVVYVVDGHGRIKYCNAAWNAFATQNNGEHLERDRIVGRHCLQGVHDPLRNFYARIYSLVLRTQKPWAGDYECSSPTKYRVFHMLVFPLSRSHLLIENSLFVERFHRRKEHVDGEGQYINRHGFVTMCAHCRRTEYRSSEGKREWHWLPGYLVTAPAPVTHGFCPTCISHYGKLALKSETILS